MIIASNLGFPRLGSRRELKTVLERYWARDISAHDLAITGCAVRREAWACQLAAGLDHIPSNDFSFYDHVLDMALTAGAVPERYRRLGLPPIDTSFAMARGIVDSAARGAGLAPLRMTKWFDTNYHYIVPEFERGQEFALESTKPIDDFLEAKAGGVQTRPVLIGPVSFLLLGEGADGARGPIGLIDGLIPVYEELLRRLAAAGAEWVQLDEPCLALDPPPAALRALEAGYARLARAAPPGLRTLVATYFGGLHANLAAALRLPVGALHLDLVRGPEQFEAALAMAPQSLSLSLGVVDGRNVWRTDLDRALTILDRAMARLGPDRVLVGPSCSLFLCPLDVTAETALDRDLRDWLAFAVQKLDEISTLVTALREGPEAAESALARSREAIRSRQMSSRIHVPAVAARVAAVGPAMLQRRSAYPERRRRQVEALRLPAWPTTTIGSFPQTPAVRAARAAFRSGKKSREEYETFLRAEIEGAIRTQEQIGLDVLVHGEFERSDMVEYFAERLDGFALTEHGWVQSYGSRCVRPPILYGDISRPRPMTVQWSRFAQSLTDRPVKGMLTGPVTLLQWSFVRDDQPRWLTCRQLALAIREEIADLEAAGLRAIQIDEPALREGLPLRHEGWPDYLRWAVDSFRLATAGAADATQIHTHMYYSEFDDIVKAILALDVDVLAIEGARSGMRILETLGRCHYPSGVGPGVWDIHSPRVPSTEEIEGRLRAARATLPPEQLWVNPDCGLKTRSWDQVRPALAAMVAAARRLRAHAALTGGGPASAGAPAGGPR